MDENILHAKVRKKHAKYYKKFEILIEGNGLYIAEDTTFEFCALLNRMLELGLVDYQGTLHLEIQFVRLDRRIGNSIHRKQGWYKKCSRKDLAN